MDRSNINRRRFCQAVAGAALGAGVRPVPLHAAASRLKLQYVLGSSMYGRLPLEQIVPQVRATGAGLIDIWPAVHGNQREQMDEMGLDKFAELLASHGVKLAMTTRYDLGPLNLSQEIPIVAKLGGRLIVTGSKGGRRAAGDQLKPAVREFIEKLKPTLELAEAHDVTIGIENHANALIETPDSMRCLAELSPSAKLGVALAPYHLPQDPALIGGLIRDLGPRLVHFYAWQHGEGSHEPMPKEKELLQMPGRGPLDFKPILASLRDIGYDRWTEIFMHPYPRGVPILPAAEQTTAEINRARGYLSQCLMEI